MPIIIEWDMIVDGFNDRYNTHHTLKSMMESLYESMGSVHRMSDVLGICSATILEKLHKLNIEVSPRGGWSRPSIKDRYLQIPQSRREKMNAKQLASELNCTYCYACILKRNLAFSTGENTNFKEAI